MTSQFHDFYNLIFGGFLSFGTTVRRLDIGQEKSGSPTEKRLTERLRKDPINDTSFSDYFVTSHTILAME